MIFITKNVSICKLAGYISYVDKLFYILKQKSLAAETCGTRRKHLFKLNVSMKKVKRKNDVPFPEFGLKKKKYL